MFANKKSTAFAATVAAVAATFVTNASLAQSQMDIDLNGFRVTGELVSATEFTLSMTDDHDTTIVSIRHDGEDAAGFYDPFAGSTSADYTAIVNLVGSKSAGVVSSGIFQLEDDMGNVFTFDEVEGTYFDSGTLIEVVLLLRSDDGEFNSNTFSGVDVTNFNNAPSLDVSVVTFSADRKLLTVDSFTDANVDADIRIDVVPSPTVTSSLGVLGGLTLLRRRRSA